MLFNSGKTGSVFVVAGITSVETGIVVLSVTELVKGVSVVITEGCVVVIGSTIVAVGAGGDCGVIPGSGAGTAATEAGSLLTGLKKGLSDGD
ncbi:MAG TPA: hypothetical protein PKU95_02705 [Candidatus Dojkabacteria bacterium]|nr:hypothetical protein [Candidatus Dojkabacteria bacterium]